MANRWLDRSQPQTLYMATILLYFNAALALVGVLLPLFSVTLVGSVIGLGELFAALGIANGKRAGFVAGVAVAIVNTAVILLGLVGVWHGGAGSVLSLLFAIAIVVLILHPMSRNYQKIWFR